jgi:hypothetical protein
MANYFTLTYDTTGPASPSMALAGGALYTNVQLINATIGTSDATTTNYQMQLWGDLDLAWAISGGIVSGGSTQVVQASSQWITYATTQQVKLSTGDGLKNVYLVIRDDVYNPSAQVSASINLDTALPTATITGPDVSKISNQTGKNVSSFSFQSNVNFSQYIVKVVSSTGADHTTGVQIPTAGGSTNMSGTAGNYTSGTVINCKIYGADLATASAGDGAKIIKVFVLDMLGNWSV